MGIILTKRAMKKTSALTFQNISNRITLTNEENYYGKSLTDIATNTKLSQWKIPEESRLKKVSSLIERESSSRNFL